MMDAEAVVKVLYQARDGQPASCFVWIIRSTCLCPLNRFEYTHKAGTRCSRKAMEASAPRRRQHIIAICKLAICTNTLMYLHAAMHAWMSSSSKRKQDRAAFWWVLNPLEWLFFMLVCQNLTQSSFFTRAWDRLCWDDSGGESTSQHMLGPGGLLYKIINYILF